MLGLHCTHFLRHQYPWTPNSFFPTSWYHRTVRGPRILGGRGFTVPHWSIQQSAPLWRSSAQVHNGPLRSCRKFEGKAPAQQSCSRQARRFPSPRMTKVTVHEKREVNEKQSNPATAHHTITTAHIRSSALVRGQSILFCPAHAVGHRDDPPKRGYIFAIFAGFSIWVRGGIRVILWLWPVQTVTHISHAWGWLLFSQLRKIWGYTPWVFPPPLLEPEPKDRNNRTSRNHWAVNIKTKCGGSCVKHDLRAKSMGISIMIGIVSGFNRNMRC